MAPPLTPNTGPSDGSRSATIARSPMRRKPSASPIVVVDFPSPAGVGVIAVTSTSAPSGRSAARAIACQPTFALKSPYGSRSSAPEAERLADLLDGTQLDRARDLEIANPHDSAFSFHHRLSHARGAARAVSAASTSAASGAVSAAPPKRTRS